jgi:hypothetical protein
MIWSILIGIYIIGVIFDMIESLNDGYKIDIIEVFVILLWPLRLIYLIILYILFKCIK